MAAVTLLEARGLTRSFGGLRAVDHVDFTLNSGEIHALIGPNGAGKTTFVSLLSGRLQPDAGQIRFDGADVTRLPAHARVAQGIAYTFQITSIYAGLTVADNLALAVQRHPTRDLAGKPRGLRRAWTGRSSGTGRGAFVLWPPAPAGNRHGAGAAATAADPG
ncbi:ATP-binding cassette domain-containing protein [Gemmobacter lanyuensis]